VVLNPALVVQLLLLLMEDVLAILVMIPHLAILNTVQWIAMWVNGPVGLRVVRAAVVAPVIALVQLLLVPVMVATPVLQPLTLKLATLAIVQLTAMRVNGVIGVRAPRPVAMAIPTALAL